jgi:hypothetical protein
MTRPSIDSALDMVFTTVKSLPHVHLQLLWYFRSSILTSAGEAGLTTPLIQSVSAYGPFRSEDNLAPFI